MLDDIVHALYACRSERELWRAHKRAGNVLTPLEIGALMEYSHRLPRASQRWLDDLVSFGRFDSGEPQRFCRQPIAANIDLYRDPFVPSEQKQLIFGFCGSGGRMMMPIACVLQYLASDHCDLVLLRDPTKMHYILGIPPYASSLPTLALRLAASFGAENYRRTVCYGTSMGGFVALQCGILIKADAAISISGRFAWHPARLLRDPTEFIPAFDPLCVCNAATVTKLVCYYNAHDLDREDAMLLARKLPVECIRMSDAPEHNVILALWNEGRLREFYEDVFELPGSKATSMSDGTMPAFTPNAVADSPAPRVASGELGRSRS